MSIGDELEKLDRLRQQGSLSQEEYEKAKNTLLREKESVSDQLNRTVQGISSDANLWSMLIHLTQFCGYIIPLAGLVVPIVLWQIKKDESAVIDQHGRIVANWIISELIYGIIFALLSALVIGVPLLLALLVVGIVFPIIGGIKANSGELWPYPLSIKFFVVNELPQD